MIKNRFRPFKEVAASEIQIIKDRLNKKIKSLLTPWKCVNVAGLNGVSWGYIVLIGGMSGCGKTLLVNQLETGLIELNEEEFHVLSLNYEMTAERLIGRKLSAFLGKSTKQLYSADTENPTANISEADIKKAEEYLTSLENNNVYYQDIAGTVDDIERQIRNHFTNNIKNPDIGMVVILDHSLLVKGKSSDDAKEILYALGDRCSLLKKQYKIIFIIITQLNRNIEVEERRSIQDSKLSFHYPIKSDISSADALYQHSDIVMILHRPFQLNLPFYGPEKLPSKSTNVYAHFLKTRDGEPFFTSLKAEYNIMKLTE